ncbi:MAG: hypothetical protein ABGW88_04065 [Leeuwenhoekiella sp.]|uniref:hypothetical protein n=1 Tax=Leeuwenhoekiella sp. TaxID=1977054 RepID=UPI003241CE69
MDKSLQIKNLLSRWQSERNYEKFCNDGILIHKEYSKANPKILFLLKESKAKFTNIEGPLGPHGDSKVFWRNMKLWTITTAKKFEKQSVDLNSFINEKEKPNTKIAYINIKKDSTITPIDSQYSEYENIKSYAVSDSEFLKKQIEIINPDVVFCGGTFCFANFIFNDLRKIDSNLYIRNNDQYWIDFYHPSCRKGYNYTVPLLSKYLEKINQY